MSGFVIYNTKNFRCWPGSNWGSPKLYATERAAKGQFTRLTKGLRAVLKDDEWAIAPYDDFLKIEPVVEVTSLMTGQPVKIKATAVGRAALDPSMEGYWCM